MTHEYIPNNLKALRKRAGLRQQDLAVKLGFEAFDRISRWEKGLCYPSVENLFLLVRLYNVQPHEIYPELVPKS
jgi:transcriptional regulator with XRE-family HTH domain